MILRILAVTLLLACALTAQTTPAAIPQYVIGVSAGLDAATSPMFHIAVPFARRLTENNYSYTTLEMNTHTASLRTGIARPVITANGFTLVGLVDGGLVTGTVSQGLGAGDIGVGFSGGGVVFYDLSSRAKIPGLYATGCVRITRTTTAAVLPAITFGVAKAF